MIDTKLIFIDGLPGSGKSTTAQYLFRHLQRNGFHARVFHEGQMNHPIHDEIEEIAMWEEDKSIANRIERWCGYVSSVRQDPVIDIFESTIFQNALSILLLKKVDREKIFHYFLRVQEILNNRRPVLIYFHQQDYLNALLKTFERKGKEAAETMLNLLIWNSSGANNPGLEAFDLFDFFHDMKKMSDELFSQFNMGKISIENSGGNWDHYHAEMTDFLQMPKIEDEHVDVDAFIGIYKESISGTECLLEAVSCELYLTFRDRKFKLIPYGDDRLMVLGEWIELIFLRAKSGKVQEMKVTSSRYFDMNDTVWLKA